MNRRALGFWVVIAVLLVLIGLATGRRSGVGEPLDPDGTDELGTAALMALLEEYGAEVDRGLPDEETEVTLILSDRMGDEQHRAIENWVTAGGTLVVTDPGSPFSPVIDPFAAGLVAGRLVAGPCDLGDGPVGVRSAALQGLALEADSFGVFPPEAAIPDPGGQPPHDPGDDSADAPSGETPAFQAPPFIIDGRCFTTAGGDHLQVTERGLGRVIALGGALALTNRHLDDADNAVLAVELLAGGGDPAGPVTVIHDPIFSAGTRTLGDLIPSGAKWSAWGLMVAAGLFVWRRSRRFGSPVPEPQPVELPASLLVRAAGELRRRSGAQAEASDVLRADLARRLRRQFKVPADLPVEALAAQAAAAAGVDPGVVARALYGPPAADGADLAALVADIDTVNAAVAAQDRSGVDRPSGPGPVPSSDPTPRTPIPVGAGESP